MHEIPSFPDLSVLVVESSPHLRKIYRELLSQVGLRRIIEAVDGAEAIGSFEQRRPNLIILDWDVHLLNGEEIIKLIRMADKSPAPKVPIIVTLAHPTRDNVMKAVTVGANEVLAKPISPRALWDHLREVIVVPRSFTRIGDHMRPKPRIAEAAAPQ